MKAENIYEPLIDEATLSSQVRSVSGPKGGDGHGHGGHGHGKSKGFALKPVDPQERRGLSSGEAEDLQLKWGYNELPVIEVPLWRIFIQQFMGTMPYMLELAIVIAAAVEDWTDFGIILAMVCLIILFYFLTVFLYICFFIIAVM